MSNDIARNKDALFSSGAPDIARTDPAFADFFSNFAFGEVPGDVAIPAEDAALAVQAVLIGAQGLEAFRRMLPVAVASGVKPVEIRETVYQSTAYCGIGRTLPFIEAVDEYGAANGVKWPAETADDRDRAERGEAVQVEAFGDHMKGFADSGPELTRHINRWLSANCFGDYYVRPGLDLRRREMVTFCFLMGQGGCEPQLTSHAMGNMHVGNDQAFLVGVVSACLPYIGYPRSLNALRCVASAAEQLSK